MKEDAVVLAAAGSGCESCKAAGECKAGDGGRILEVDNTVSARPGQMVELNVESGAFLKASFVVYMVPVIFLFIGAALGDRIGPMISGAVPKDAWQAGLGVLFLALSIAVLRLIDKKTKASRALRPVITRIKEG
jgi:sigma-E factor negative regulatory protein RseC